MVSKVHVALRLSLLRFQLLQVNFNLWCMRPSVEWIERPRFNCRLNELVVANSKSKLNQNKIEFDLV